MSKSEMKIIGLAISIFLLGSCSYAANERYYIDDSRGSPICTPRTCHKLEEIVIDVLYPPAGGEPRSFDYSGFVKQWLDKNTGSYPSYPEIKIQNNIKNKFYYYSENLASKVLVRVIFFEQEGGVIVNLSTLSSYAIYSDSFYCEMQSQSFYRECISEKMDIALTELLDGYKYNVKISG